MAGRRVGASTFEDIYRAHVEYVFTLALRLSGQKAEADDLTQETFLRAFRYLDGYAGGSLRAWLRRILVNRFLTRVQAQRPVLSLEEEAERRRPSVDRALVDSREDPGDRLEAETLDGRIQQAIQGIPAEYRTVLVLREIEDLSYEQIASLLSVPIGTVRSRLARARALLRHRLGGTG